MSRSKSGEHTIVNDLGLHARAASKLVGVSNRFAAEAWIGRAGNEVNAKSILGVLMLACPKGSKVSLRCEGEDAVAAYDAIAALIEDGFGEL